MAETPNAPTIRAIVDLLEHFGTDYNSPEAANLCKAAIDILEVLSDEGAKTSEEAISKRSVSCLAR